MDKTKWVFTQSLLDACKAHGLDSSTRAELQPQSNAQSVLDSFFSRNTDEGDLPQEDHKEVESPEKLERAVQSPSQPPRKATKHGSAASGGSDTEDDEVIVQVCA